MNFQSNQEKIIPWWQTECKKESTPELVIKLSWEVNIRQLQEDEQPIKYVGF